MTSCIFSIRILVHLDESGKNKLSISFRGFQSVRLAATSQPEAKRIWTRMEKLEFQSIYASFKLCVELIFSIRIWGILDEDGKNKFSIGSRTFRSVRLAASSQLKSMAIWMDFRRFRTMWLIAFAQSGFGVIWTRIEKIKPSADFHSFQSM